MDLSIVSGLLRALAGVAGSGIAPIPALVVQIASIAASLIDLGEQGQADLKALSDQVAKMAASGRNPTAAEWDDLRSRSEVAHAAIQAAASGSS